MQAEFKAHRKPTLYESIMRIVEKEKKFRREHTAEEVRQRAHEGWVRAGVITPTGRLTKPFRMMIKRDEEDAARAAAKVAVNA